MAALVSLQSAAPAIGIVETQPPPHEPAAGFSHAIIVELESAATPSPSQSAYHVVIVQASMAVSCGGGAASRYWNLSTSPHAPSARIAHTHVVLMRFPKGMGERRALPVFVAPKV